MGTVATVIYGVIIPWEALDKDERLIPEKHRLLAGEYDCDEQGIISTYEFENLYFGIEGAYDDNIYINAPISFEHLQKLWAKIKDDAKYKEHLKTFLAIDGVPKGIKDYVAAIPPACHIVFRTW